MVPPSLARFLVLLPKHNRKRIRSVIVDALEVHPRITGLEVVTPSSQERIEPLLDEFRKIPMLPTTVNIANPLLDRSHRLGRRIVVGL